MRILRWLLPLIFVSTLAHAQTGYLMRSDCTTLTAVQYNTLCQNTGSGGTLLQGRFYSYNGSGWDLIEITASKGVANGYASLDGSVLIPVAQVPPSHAHTTSAGAPAAGSCNRAGEVVVDTTNTDFLFCAGTGTNPVSVDTLIGDNYNQVTGDSGAVSAVGNETLKISGGTGLTMTCAAGSPDTCTMEVDSAGITVAKVASPLKTKTITFRIGSDQASSALADTDDESNVFTNDLAAMHITQVRCSSDAGSPIINLQRDDGSAANILSSNLTCATGRAGATSTSFTAGEDALATGNAINFVMVTAGGTAKRVTVTITATLD